MFKPQPIQVAINIPSGKIIFDDDLRSPYKEAENGKVSDLNGPLGLKLTTFAYAKYGLFHGYVGNSCPGIYKHGNLYIIGNPSYDHEKYKSRNDLLNEQVGNICTNLWWYSIADYDEFISRIEKLGQTIKDYYHTASTLEVEPGRYVLKHYYPHFGMATIKAHKGVEICATFERSDEEIVNVDLPEEHIEDVVRAIPNVSYAHIGRDKNKFDEMNKNPKLIYKYYQFLIHWKIPELVVTDRYDKIFNNPDGTIFTEPKFSGDELSDTNLVTERVLEDLEERLVEERARIKRNKEHDEWFYNLSPEEKKAHNEKIGKIFKEILAEIKAEENSKKK